MLAKTDCVSNEGAWFEVRRVRFRRGVEELQGEDRKLRNVSKSSKDGGEGESKERERRERIVRVSGEHREERTFRAA